VQDSNEISELPGSADREPGSPRKFPATVYLIALLSLAIFSIATLWLARSQLSGSRSQTAPPSAASTKVAGLQASPTPLAPLLDQPLPSPTPWPTAVQDLSMVVQQADAIAEARVYGTNGAMHSRMYWLEIENWLKKPGTIMTNRGLLWIPDPWDYYPSDYFRQMRVDRGDQLILFMTAHLNNTLFKDMPDYYLAGGPSGGYFNSGFFQIANGRIIFGGISSYDGWSVEDFETTVTRLSSASP